MYILAWHADQNYMFMTIYMYIENSSSKHACTCIHESGKFTINYMIHVYKVSTGRLTKFQLTVAVGGILEQSGGLILRLDGTGAK